ncbi:fungal chitosanase of glycosyl hydrolase group 75-domain-containing protein [Mycena crocata]|nr:fungal chitosanase of glycosyl hydrolase group 75-domain-containing protein [Mycena crocata]
MRPVSASYSLTALLVVGALSSVGAAPLRMDDSISAAGSFPLSASKSNTGPTSTRAGAADPPTPSSSSGPSTSNSSSVPFAADASLNVAALYAAVQAATSMPLENGTFPTTSDEGAHIAQIYGDWLALGSGSGAPGNSSSVGLTDYGDTNSTGDPESNFQSRAKTNNTGTPAGEGVVVFHFIADMDTDCDGPEMNCAGNTDGQPKTSFGTLDATSVPYFVLPLNFTESHTDILQPNALGAVICGGKMFYGIYGDQCGDDPQVIGEASMLMGQTCFPDVPIDGGSGHTEPDVAYIVFGTQVPPGVGDSSIDVAALKEMGDAQVTLLQEALGI